MDTNLKEGRKTRENKKAGKESKLLEESHAKTSWKPDNR